MCLLRHVYLFPFTSVLKMAFLVVKAWKVLNSQKCIIKHRPYSFKYLNASFFSLEHIATEQYSKSPNKGNMLSHIFPVLFSVSLCSNICQIDVLFQICGIWRHYMDLWLVLTFLRLGNCDNKYHSLSTRPRRKASVQGYTMVPTCLISEQCHRSVRPARMNQEVMIYQCPLRTKIKYY